MTSGVTIAQQATSSFASVPPKARVHEKAHRGRTVWERLWQYQPSRSRDEAMLRREKRSSRWRMIADHVQATFGGFDGLETIELGSGRGDLSVLMAQHGAQPTLLDVNDTVLRQARQRFETLGLRARFVKGDMLNALDAQRNRFDVTLSSGVIEHFQASERTRVIRAHYRVLKPGGLAVISVPNAWCLPYRMWKLYLEIRGWWPYGMEIPYTRKELARRARACGFQRIETRCMEFRRSLRCAATAIPFLRSIGTVTPCRGAASRWEPPSRNGVAPVPGSLSSLSPWWDRPSMFDERMGMVLLMVGRRREEG